MKSHMAGYRQHISVSGFLGIAYGLGATFLLDFTPVQATLAGCLAWVAGMLPDLDSESGRPVREIFGLIAAVVPFEMMGHLLEWGGNPEGAMLLAVLTYAAIRYGGALVLGKLSVHRGMFHSIPAMLIAAELAFLGYKSDLINVKLLMAGGVALGFLSHLILDEMYSVEWSGIRVRLNKSAGSACKLVGKKFGPNLVTYALLVVLTYAMLVEMQLVDEPGATHGLLRQAVEDVPLWR
jgi:hypothetical protein